MKQFLISIDQTLNTVLGGTPEELDGLFRMAVTL